MKKAFIYQIVLAIGVLFLLAFTMPQDQKIGGPWEIPAEYKSKENPYKGDESVDRLGRNIYRQHCRSCHGNNGQGDGPMGKNQETFPGDFTTADFQSYTDGEIYYMSIIGRDEMPNFESELPDEEERWAVVNYIRTMK